jgi:hypothetical protein
VLGVVPVAQCLDSAAQLKYRTLAEALGNYKCGAIEVWLMCVGIAPLL